MTRYAIIDGGAVVNVAVAEEPLDADWVASETAQIGDAYDGSAFTSPPAPPAYPTAEAALLAMVAWIEALHASITGPVPLGVQFGWKPKGDWARAWNADNTVPVPSTITDEMAAAGSTYPNLQALVTKIIAKADIYEGVLADTEGLRTKTQDLIEAEAAKPTPDPHQYQVILQAAQAEAIQLAAARGISLPTT